VRRRTISSVHPQAGAECQQALTVIPRCLCRRLARLGRSVGAHIAAAFLSVQRLRQTFGGLSAASSRRCRLIPSPQHQAGVRVGSGVEELAT
jgi:hypothetical protein